MKAIVGLILVCFGVVLGLYVGICWAFIGGIVDVIKAIRAPELEAMTVAVGVAKVCFAGLIGWLAALLAIVPGMAMIKGA